MIADLKPYAEYKDSGLSWLGQMPWHWETRRSKYLFRETDQRSVAGTEQRLSMSQRHGLIPSSQLEERRLVSESSVGGKLCEAGDLVLNRLKAHLGVLAVSPTHGVVSPDYTVLRPIGTTNHHYFCAVYRSPHCGQELRRRAKGIVEGFWRLYTDDFYDIRIPVPPPEEQAAIVRFLDWAGGRLERTIRAKRKVIALLTEQKRVIVHRAVTCGLNPHVALKPSGVSWLGEIPQHWAVRKLRSLFYTQGSGTTPNGDRYYGGSIRWVMSGDLNDSIVTVTKRSVQQHALTAYSTLKLYPANSLVVAMYGATIGKTGILGGDACTNQACCVLARPVPYANVSFMQLIVQTAKPHLVRAAYGGGQPNINAEVVRALRVPLPSFEEQGQIVASAEDATAKVNATIQRLEREIDLLREYRMRLVADVVTGKFDVREAAARLPEESNVDLPDVPADEFDESERTDEEADA